MRTHGNWTGRNRTLRDRVVSLAAAVTVVAGSAFPGAAAAAPATPQNAGAADFSVSTSADPVTPDAGGQVRTELTVSNNGDHTETVKLRLVRVQAGDDGRAELGDDDPFWSKYVTVVPSLRLAAHQYRRVPVVIRVPSGLLPDLYLLGFVAEAEPSQPDASVRIFHRIGAMITLQLAGVRERRLDVRVDRTPLLRIGSSFDGTFAVRNVGQAAAMARSQLALSSALTGGAIATLPGSDGVQLVPAGTARHVGFSYQVHGFFLYAHPQAQVLYSNGSASLLTVTSTGRPMLVIPWWTLVLLAGTATALAAYVWWTRRRRAAHRRAQAAADRRRPRAGSVIPSRTGRGSPITG